MSIDVGDASALDEPIFHVDRDVEGARGASDRDEFEQGLLEAVDVVDGAVALERDRERGEGAGEVTALERVERGVASDVGQGPPTREALVFAPGQLEQREGPQASGGALLPGRAGVHEEPQGLGAREEIGEVTGEGVLRATDEELLGVEHDALDPRDRKRGVLIAHILCDRDQEAEFELSASEPGVLDVGERVGGVRQDHAGLKGPKTAPGQGPSHFGRGQKREHGWDAFGIKPEAVDLITSGAQGLMTSLDCRGSLEGVGIRSPGDRLDRRCGARNQERASQKKQCASMYQFPWGHAVYAVVEGVG